MKFKIISHAGLWVEHNHCKVLMDPWIVGSCYWRSWWNFPEPQVEANILRPDFIYITHIHWDHFHGPSLRKFSRKTPILIPKDRYDRMKRDLNSIGFQDVREISNGMTYKLAEDFYLTPYLFGLFTDSAVVLSSQRYTLLNANDCKIIGWPLKRLLQRHPKIDFAFRSHSSANARISHEFIDTPNDKLDDRERYMLSFCHFMRAVAPTFAIPFASNLCHLHKDTIRFNEWGVSPMEMRSFYENHRQSLDLSAEIKVMLPGSQWDEESGFNLVNLEPFSDRTSQLAAYQQRKEKILLDYYLKEEKVNVTTKEMEKYFRPFFNSLFWPLRVFFRKKEIYIRAGNLVKNPCWRLNLLKKEIQECGEEEFLKGRMQITYPSLVLKQCLGMNMFSHAGISKRPLFKADRVSMKYLIVFELFLKLREYEFLPLRTVFSPRSLSCWFGRWREILEYSRVFYLRFLRRKSMVAIEQQRLLLRPIHARAALKQSV